jgi:hypothetical protein
MSIMDIVPPFAKLDLPPVEEFQKRKVALISGAVAWCNICAITAIERAV